MSEGQREEGSEDVGAGSQPWPCHPPCPSPHLASPLMLLRLFIGKMGPKVIGPQDPGFPSVRSLKPKC